MNFPPTLRINLCLIALAVFPGWAFAGTFYQITDLGTLGGTSSFALDVNNKGQVTGNAQTPTTTPSPRLNAFSWGPPSGPMTNLGVLPGSNNFSRGYAINDNGVIVGESDNNTSQAFRSENSTMTNLGSLGGNSGVAHDINNAGLIVGISSNGSISRPFVYDGTLHDLGTIAGTADTTGRAWSISNSGLIAGVSGRGGSLSSHATLWEGGAGGTRTDLGALVDPSNFSQAYAVNDNHQVVGSSVVGKVSPTSSTDLNHAFLWQGGVMSDLGTLTSRPTFIQSEAKDINASGLAVGYVAQFFNSPTLGGAAVLWEPGTILDLNTSLVNGIGWNLQTAEGINDRGQIVGYGQFQGSTRAFLLTPVPEPSGLILCSTVLAALVVRQIRRRHRDRLPHSPRRDCPRGARVVRGNKDAFPADPQIMKGSSHA